MLPGLQCMSRLQEMLRLVECALFCLWLTATWTMVKPVPFSHASEVWTLTWCPLAAEFATRTSQPSDNCYLQTRHCYLLQVIFMAFVTGTLWFTVNCNSPCVDIPTDMYGYFNESSLDAMPDHLAALIDPDVAYIKLPPVATCCVLYPKSIPWCFAWHVTNCGGRGGALLRYG